MPNRRPIGPLALSEQDIQRAVFRHLKTRGVPGLVAFHPPMGGYRRRIEAAIFVGLGALKGVSDVIAIKPPDGRVYALELKTIGNRPTPEQSAFLDRVRAAGGVADWRAGLDPALEWLEAQGLLMGRSSR